MKTLNIFLFIIMISLCACTVSTDDIFDEPSTELVDDIYNNPMLIELDSIAEQLQDEGWTADASYLIAGFAVDLYDESDTAEYRLYCAYMED